MSVLQVINITELTSRSANGGQSGFMDVKVLVNTHGLTVACCRLLALMLFMVMTIHWQMEVHHAPPGCCM